MATELVEEQHEVDGDHIVLGVSLICGRGVRLCGLCIIRHELDLLLIYFFISQDRFCVSLEDGVGVVSVEVPLDPVDRVAKYRWPAVGAVHVRAEEVGFLVPERLLDELRFPVEESGQAFM